MATRSSFPVHCFKSDFERAAIPSATSYFRELVMADSMNKIGTVTKGDLGNNIKVHGITAITTDEGGTWAGRIPDWYDRSDDIWVRVLFMAGTADKNPKWEVSYNAFTLGDDFDVDPDTALDDTISQNTDGAAGDAGYIRTTDWGRIDGPDSFTDDDEFLAWKVRCRVTDGVANWKLVGVEIMWPRELV